MGGAILPATVPVQRTALSSGPHRLAYNLPVSPRPPRQQSVSPAPLLVAALLLAAAGFAATRSLASPAPFGTALPLSTPIIESEAVDYGATDFLARRIPPAWLDSLAPQPDGTPPLHHGYRSERGSFSIRHPRGFEVTQPGAADFRQADVDAYVQVHHNQPLQSITYSMPGRANGERVTEFASRMRHEIVQLGGTVNPERKVLELPRYRFEVLELSYHLDSGKPGEAGAQQRERVWYVGPLGARLLVAEFALNPAAPELGRAQAAKIMQSFSPGINLALLMLEEDPDYGEWAGSLDAARKAAGGAAN